MRIQSTNYYQWSCYQHNKRKKNKKTMLVFIKNEKGSRTKIDTIGTKLVKIKYVCYSTDIHLLSNGETMECREPSYDDMFSLFFLKNRIGRMYFSLSHKTKSVRREEKKKADWLLTQRKGIDARKRRKKKYNKDAKHQRKAKKQKKQKVMFFHVAMVVFMVFYISRHREKYSSREKKMHPLFSSILSKLFVLSINNLWREKKKKKHEKIKCTLLCLCFFAYVMMMSIV